MDKEKMIEKLEEAKAIVSDVWEETMIDGEIGEVGDVLCDIDEAINAIKEGGE